MAYKFYSVKDHPYVDYSAAKSFMRKMIKDERAYLFPRYIQRLRLIIESAPQKMGFSLAAQALLKGNSYDPDASIFSLLPTEKQNNNSDFIANCFSIFGKKKSIAAVLDEYAEIQELLY